MSSPFVAEIRIFAGNFAPTGWAQCNGQILPISQNTALFSLLGTVYGGNGQSTFALPNLEGSFPMHPGLGAGLSQRDLGEAAGTEFVTLITTEMPAHKHFALGVGGQANQQLPGITAPATVGNSWATTAQRPYLPAASGSPMSPNSLSLSGGSLPHNNLMPYLVLNFIIALQGVFPPRS